MNYRLWAKIASIIMIIMMVEEIYAPTVGKYGFDATMLTNPWVYVLVVFWVAAYSVIITPLIHFGFSKPKHE